MSTDGRFRQLNPALMRVVFEDAEQVERIKAFEPPCGYDPDSEESPWPPRVRELWDALVRSGGQDEAAAEALYEEVSEWCVIEPEDLPELATSGLSLDDLPATIDFDGAKWPDLHLLVTGEVWDREWPPSPLLGEHVVSGPEDYYGALALKPEEVAAAAQVLAAVPENEMRARYRAAVAAGGLPDDMVEEMVGLFGEVRDHYADAARRGHGMMVYRV
jgi:hypothetical protein